MTPATLYRLALCAAISASATLCLGAPLAPDAINGASDAADKDGTAVLIKTQVLLDRAGLSPGVIDGRVGENLNKALAAFQRRNGLAPSGTLDRKTFEKLAATSNEPVPATYEISQKDVQGPFAKKIPPSLVRPGTAVDFRG